MPGAYAEAMFAKIEDMLDGLELHLNTVDLTLRPRVLGPFREWPRRDAGLVIVPDPEVAFILDESFGGS